MRYTSILSSIRYTVGIVAIVSLVACGGGTAETSSTSAVDSSSTSSPAASATLNWVPPTENTDGTSIASLGGHNIYVNNGSGYVLLVSINNPSVSTYIVENLASGTYSFVVTAFDSDGIESSFSNEAIITI